MSASRQIPDSTLELFARSIYKQGIEYGFQHADYLRLVNFLLDVTMQNGASTLARHVDHVSSKGPDVRTLPILGQNVNIRAYQHGEDCERLHRWINDPVGRYFLLSCLSTSAATADDMAQNPKSHLGIITLKDDKPIGVIGFLDVNPDYRKAELRKMIGEKEYRGKGLAKEATALWIRYGLETLKLQKIYLNTLDTNLRNIKLNEELGFKVEGILRNEVFFDNNYHDVLRMGLIV